MGHRQMDSLDAEFDATLERISEQLDVVNSQSPGQSAGGALDGVMQQVGRLGLLARSAGLDGVHESCFYFYQLLQALNQRNIALQETEAEALGRWSQLIRTCQGEPFSVELVERVLKYFRDSVWPIRLEADVVNDIYDAFRRQGSRKHRSEQFAAMGPGDGLPEEGAPEEDELVRALEEEITESIAALLQEIDDLRTNGSEEETASAFECCADRLELLVMSAADSGLRGMAQVCERMQGILRAWSEGKKRLSTGDRELLREWSVRLIAYLKGRGDSNATESLVDLMSVLSGMAGLSDFDPTVLLEALEPGVREDIEGSPSPGVLVHEQEPVGEPEGKEVDPREFGTSTVLAEEESAGILDGHVRELVELVRAELAGTADVFEDLLGQWEAAANPKNCKEVVEGYGEWLTRYRVAADSVGLTGLSTVLAWLQENVEAAARAKGPLELRVRQLLGKWPALGLGYLDSLPGGEGSHALMALLLEPGWPIALGESRAQEFLAQLQSPQLLVEDEESEPRATRAELADVSLSVPEDVNSQLIDSLLQELPSHTAELSAAIGRLVAGAGRLEDLDTAQRIAHTLKGSANTVGIAGVANLTHHLEDMLLAFARQEVLPTHPVADVLLDAADTLEAMTEALLGMVPPPTDAQATLQNVLDWANRIDREGIPRGEEASKASDSESVADQSGQGDPQGHDGAGAGGMLRVPATLVDQLLRLVGESLILTGQLKNRLEQADAEKELVREQHALFQQLTTELEHLVETQGITATHFRGSGQGDFDALELERYNELHTVTHRLVEAATDAAELTAGIDNQLHELDELLLDQRKLLKEEEQLVMQTRMVPVTTIAPRLQRAARQAARQTGKDVQLHVEGAETMVDSQVLSDLVSALTHLLRNAVDHGIERAEERAERGKPAAGNITIRFRREGDHVVVSCQDDGNGLDIQTIRNAAEARGLIESGEELADQELMNFILRPGFSTRDQATQVSGRGIGMDAVYSCVNRLNGTLHVDSDFGQGCRIELRLPLTLISVHAFLVSANERTIAVSSRGVEQILYAGAGQVKHESGALSLEYEGDSYESWFLETLLGLPVAGGVEDVASRPVLLVRDGSSKLRAVLVSEVIATQDMVVKQLGTFVPVPPGIEGATVLGDGSVAPLIDLSVLIGQSTGRTSIGEFEPSCDAGKAEGPPCALVVDDSLSARRALADFMRDLGYEVRTARDGLDAIEVLSGCTPVVMLVDLEMPRMNGLELATHVRAQPGTRDIPMVMITSRSTEKHRRMAKDSGINVYMTKPFSEDDLGDHIRQLAELPMAASA